MGRAVSADYILINTVTRLQTKLQPPKLTQTLIDPASPVAVSEGQ